MSELTKLGLIAGKGAMPLEIIKCCQKRGIEVFVVGLNPFALESDFDHVPHIMARMGDVGKIFKFLDQNGIKDVVMAGGIQRPSLKEIFPDWEGTKILAKLAIKKMGDDNLFRAVISVIEERGIKVRGIEDVVPEMMFHQGVYGKIKPTEDDMSDIQRGIDVARVLGAADVGQAVVVQEGLILAVEAVEGTDRMLERAAMVKRKGQAPIMVKIKKPGQDSRTDMPAIGLRTIEQLKANGIGGIAVEAGGILVIEREGVIELADKSGIFIIGVKV